ncbi:hypothetical protein C8Q80DRAFT_1121344 [Daedaleopsis nitida]|nr:hypothetical protein C8Q80DRAFT_1121344 [Daedaleopsis nitida]
MGAVTIRFLGRGNHASMSSARQILNSSMSSRTHSYHRRVDHNHGPHGKAEPLAQKLGRAERDSSHACPPPLAQLDETAVSTLVESVMSFHATPRPARRRPETTIQLQLQLLRAVRARLHCRADGSWIWTGRATKEWLPEKREARTDWDNASGRPCCQGSFGDRHGGRWWTVHGPLRFAPRCETWYERDFTHSKILDTWRGISFDVHWLEI